MRIEKIGDATLYLGDCMEVVPTLHKVDAVVTDPPYVISTSGGSSYAKKRVKHLKVINNHIDKGFDISLLNSFKNWFVFCGKHQIVELIQFAESQNLRWQLLTWNKTNPIAILTCNTYLNDAEYMIHAFEKMDFLDKRRFIVGPSEISGFDHPTVKPQYVMTKAINTASHLGDVVADFFMGTGSTGVACAQMGRSFIGIEKELKYFDIACRRIEQAYKQGQLFKPQSTKQIQSDLL